RPRGSFFSCLENAVTRLPGHPEWASLGAGGRMSQPISPTLPLNEAAAEFVQVSKSYPGGWFRRSRLAPPVRAVEGVSLRIDRGEVFALVGPNRAGKTTLVKLLLSLARPSAGRVFRLGLPSADRRSLVRVGYVHENHAFPRYLGARELLECYGALSLLPWE